MPPQQSEHLRARIWALIGAIAAFTFVIGVTVYDQLGPFARGLADGNYDIAQLLK
jgi:hypothetical protein